MTPDELTGRSRTHVVEVADPACCLHVHAVTAFVELRRAALEAGLDVQPVSSFRDFGRQVSIWNGKFNGERPLYDAQGDLLDALTLSPAQRVQAILLWSALPGASRHHWGTDLDLIDARATAPGYRVQLSAAEFAADGPYAPLSAWLDRHAAHFGFFRPFRGVHSGVRAEPWHVSFAPVADRARRELSVAVLRSALVQAPLQGKDEILTQLGPLHARYVNAIDPP